MIDPSSYGEHLIDQLKKATLREVEVYCQESFPDESYPDMTFIDHLTYADRWPEIRQIAEGKLRGWERYQQEAKRQWELRVAIIRMDAEDDQRREGLHPKIKELSDIGMTIWWHCRVYYPYSSRNCEVDPCLAIVGDGLGMAYFQVDDFDGPEESVMLVKGGESMIGPAFEICEIKPFVPTTFANLKRAFQLFADGVNAKRGRMGV